MQRQSEVPQCPGQSDDDVCRARRGESRTPYTVCSSPTVWVPQPYSAGSLMPCSLHPPLHHICYWVLSCASPDKNPSMGATILPNLFPLYTTRCSAAQLSWLNYTSCYKDPWRCGSDSCIPCILASGIGALLAPHLHPHVLPPVMLLGIYNFLLHSKTPTQHHHLPNHPKIIKACTHTHDTNILK